MLLSQEHHSSPAIRPRSSGRNKTLQGIGKIHVRIPITDKFSISVSPEIVDANIPFLLGLNVLSHLEELVDFQKNTMSRQENWLIPLT